MTPQQREALLNAIAGQQPAALSEVLNKTQKDVRVYTSSDEWLFDLYKSVMGGYPMPAHEVAFSDAETDKLKPLEQTLQSLKNNR